MVTQLGKQNKAFLKKWGSYGEIGKDVMYFLLALKLNLSHLKNIYLLSFNIPDTLFICQKLGWSEPGSTKPWIQSEPQKLTLDMLWRALYNIQRAFNTIFNGIWYYSIEFNTIQQHSMQNFPDLSLAIRVQPKQRNPSSVLNQSSSLVRNKE